MISEIRVTIELLAENGAVLDEAVLLFEHERFAGLTGDFETELLQDLICCMDALVERYDET